MPKFSALSCEALLTAEADAARAARALEYATQATPFAAVVFVECDDGSWCELDAESADHAVRMADTWVASMGARGASCRLFAADGMLTRRTFYTRFATHGEWD